MFERLFLAHPRAVGESYTLHMRTASRFGCLMIIAGMGTMFHGLIPALFTHTGSSMVRRLHREMEQRLPENGSKNEDGGSCL